ncbi:ACRC protein-like protein [Camelus ferus]|nr:ACRC protein-like protein [Camelus ferus]
MAFLGTHKRHLVDVIDPTPEAPEREYVSYDLPPSPGSIKGRAPRRLPQSLGISHALDSQSEASSGLARPEAAEADTDMSEAKAGRLKIQDDDCYIITVDSSSDEEPDTIAIGVNVQKGDVSYVVIDSDSEDECFHEILEVLSDTEEKPCQEPPIIIIDDDDDDLEGPVIIEDDSCDEGQTPSNEQKKDEFTIFQRKTCYLIRTGWLFVQLPEKIDIGWNKKMLRTAGLCTTGEIRRPKRQRYAKIEISLKVCDSADRLRDTLIHEICHAASWLLDGIRDSHGDAWKYYARKSNMVHPELPKVTRCHNYEINYRIVYECTKCKSRIGRYTRSLNTDRFICAQCRGPLVMLPQTRKDGTPIQPHVRPFAKYVKENYRIVQRQTEGISHGDVMRKLSKDFAAKKKMLGL